MPNLESLRIPILTVITLTVFSHSTGALATPANSASSEGVTASLSQTLPLIRIPAKLSKNDEKALALVSQISILPVTTRVFPDYRPRAYDENEQPISAWSLKEYNDIAALQKLSEPLRQLPISQLMSLESKVAGINKHGMLTDLKNKTTETHQSAKTIMIDSDNADSLLAALPPSWNSVAERVKRSKGNHVEEFEVGTWTATFGDDQTRRVLKAFSNLEREKGRPRQVWAFAIAEEGSKEKIYNLKKKLKPLGYETYAYDKECIRRFFTNRKEAELYAKNLPVGISSGVVQEGPAQLVMDQQANVISTSGQVVRKELDAASKKRCDELERQGNFVGQILKFFGMKDGISTHIFVGVRFQFNNYPVNWIPPKAKITKLENNRLQITVPQRFAVTTQVREAFAVKDFDQYKYLVAQGITAINYGMSGKDVVAQLKRWDKKYQLSVLHAGWDFATVKLENVPTDLPAFEKELKQFCPSVAENNTQDFRNSRVIGLWWD